MSSNTQDYPEPGGLGLLLRAAGIMDLALNPNDNHGFRGMMVNQWLSEGKDAEVWLQTPGAINWLRQAANQAN